MHKTVDVTLNKKYSSKIAQGYPLIEEDTLVTWRDIKEEGTLINMYNPSGTFVAKGYYGRQNKGYGWVLSNDRDERIDEAFFTRRFQNAIKRRLKYQEDPRTTAYRLFNGEGDGVGGLTIDYLDGHYLITWYSVGIYGYKAMVLSALTGLVDFKSIYQKKRFDAKGRYLDEDDFVMGTVPDFPVQVLENGIKFAVYLNDGPMIGFFLDQKDVRKILRDKYAKDKHVLNTFSYTGAFSVAAALGGAAQTTSVDLANRSRSRTREQFEINGIDQDAQTIIVDDVFDYFNYLIFN